MPTNVCACLFLFEPTVAITTLPGASSSDLTTLLGTELADTFALDANNLSVDGLDGSDTVTASDAIDKVTLSTGIGNDRVTLSGDFSNGSLLLGTGSDVASLQNVEASSVVGDRGNDSFDFKLICMRFNFYVLCMQVSMD